MSMNGKRRARVLASRALGPRAMEESNLVHRLLRRDGPGVMLDVGAHFGHTLLPFADNGWEVHAFEPDASNRAHLARNTAHLSNVTVVPMAVSDAPGELTLYRSQQSSGVSSLSAFTDSHEPSDIVPVTTLSTYLETTAPPEITFLKVDVEGYEQNVLRGLPWERHLPRAIVLEFEDSKTSKLGYLWTDLADELRQRGYEVLVSEWRPIVRYGVEHIWRRFFRYPGTLKDPAGWGNLLAVQSSDYPRLQALARIASAQHKTWRALERLAGSRRARSAL